MLHITGRRTDGYHELQTIFQFLQTGDELQFTRRDDNEIFLAGSHKSVAMQDDLVYRAASLLKKQSGCREGVNINLTKKLPLGAGLGGGSSDAATCLLALNHLWQLDYSIEQLAEIGLQLGADVPVFIHGVAAFAEGIGEKITPIILEEPWFLVLTPPVHVSTKEIFCNPQLTRDCSAIKICDLSRHEWLNVCTEIVVKEYLEVAQAIEILNNFSIGRMSGTGASVFARFDKKAQAEAALAKIRANHLPESWKCILSRGLNESPLRTFIKKLDKKN